MATLKEARQALAAQIDTAVTDTDIDVLSFDPPDGVPPLITVATAGVTSTTWRLTVRLYVDAGQSDLAADFLDDLLETVDLLMDDTTARTDWDWDYDDLKGLYLMVTTVDYPREDM
jgi:hypothetical protein